MGLKASTRKLIKSFKKPTSGGAMYRDIKKFPMVAGARKSAAEAIKRIKSRIGSKGYRRRKLGGD